MNSNSKKIILDACAVAREHGRKIIRGRTYDTYGNMCALAAVACFSPGTSRLINPVDAGAKMAGLDGGLSFIRGFDGMTQLGIGSFSGSEYDLGREVANELFGLRDSDVASSVVAGGQEVEVSKLHPVGVE